MTTLSSSNVIFYSFKFLQYFVSCKEESKISVSPDATDFEKQYYKDYESPALKWGFIDKKGDYVMDPIYDDLRDFKRSFADSRIENWTVPADGEYAIEIRDMHLRGGASFVYFIEAVKAEPHFRLYADTDKTLLAPVVAHANFERRNGGVEGGVGVYKAALEAVSPDCRAFLYAHYAGFTERASAAASLRVSSSASSRCASGQRSGRAPCWSSSADRSSVVTGCAFRLIVVLRGRAARRSVPAGARRPRRRVDLDHARHGRAVRHGADPRNSEPRLFQRGALS